MVLINSFVTRFGLKQAWLALMCCLMLSACGGGGGTGPSGITSQASGYPQSPAACTSSGERAWLRDYMNDQYFWPTSQGVPDEAAASISAYLDSLLFKPIDRYSYAQSTALYNQFFADGRRTGYGYSLAFADTAQTVIKISLVEPLSPVGQGGGLRRGDTVVSINGLNAAQIAAGQLTPVTTPGVPRTFVVQDALGAQRSLTVASADFALTPVMATQVFTAANGDKVGYLMYQEFITGGAAAMGSAIDSFRLAGVAHVILDLRYNGGGSVSQARNLASMIGGPKVVGAVFAQYRFNAKNAGNNFSQTFNNSSLPAMALANLGKVVVITSGNTASASETVINSLRPFMTVDTIGSTTYGKPYAFLPRAACDTTYSVVNLELANAIGFSDFSAGFAPTCAMSDDLTRQLGDPAELRTAAALSFIATGACPPVAQSGQAQTAIKKVANGRTPPDLNFGEVGPRQARMD